MELFAKIDIRLGSKHPSALSMCGAYRNNNRILAIVVRHFFFIYSLTNGSNPRVQLIGGGIYMRIYRF